MPRGEAVVPREAAEPRVVVPVERDADEAERDVPGAAERETLVRPVLERRDVPREAAELEAVEPPARVRPLLRPEAPPREIKLRVLREASRWPTWRAWLFRWSQRPDQPPTP